MFVVACSLPAAAGATTIAVTTTASDPGPANGQGACVSGGACSLRQAVNTAPSIVDISGAPTVIVLPAATLARDGALGPVQITSSLTIAGQGARATTILGSGDPAPSGALTLTGPVGGPAPAVTLRDLAITGGVAPISVSHGGGVAVLRGALTLQRVSVRDNLARSDASTTGEGGGIAINTGSLTVSDSAISGNQVTGVKHANNSAGGVGGGVSLISSFATITNSSVAGNTVDAVTGSASGGGINLLGGSARLDGVTVARNVVKGAADSSVGGNLAAVSNAVTAETTIIAGGQAPVGGNCFAHVASQGGNVEDTDQCGLTNATDRPSADPQLGALQNNGGSTDTMAIPATSPAFDRSTTCDLVADQRGTARPQSAACDSGAFEAPPPPVSSPPPAAPAGSGQAATGSSVASTGGGLAPSGTALQAVPARCTLTPAGYARRLRLLITCDEAVEAQLETKATITRRTVRARRARRKAKKPRVLTLPPATAQVPAGATTTIVLRLPRTVVAAARRRDRVSLAFVVTAVTEGGARSQLSTTLARLRPGKRVHKRG